MKAKINGKSMALTCGLFILLGIVIMIGIAVFISGPARKYEDKIVTQKEAIQSTYNNINNIQRHVFHYIVYVGEDLETYVWFNEAAEAITSRKKETLQEAKVKEIAATKYKAKDVKISLGYGYNNPVYVIQSDVGVILLDYDTLEEAHFQMKGDK